MVYIPEYDIGIEFQLHIKLNGSTFEEIVGIKKINPPKRKGSAVEETHNKTGTGKTFRPGRHDPGTMDWEAHYKPEVYAELFNSIPDRTIFEVYVKDNGQDGTWNGSAFVISCDPTFDAKSNEISGYTCEMQLCDEGTFEIDTDPVPVSMALTDNWQTPKEKKVKSEKAV